MILQTILKADESLVQSLTSKTGPGEPPFEASDKGNRLSIKVAYSSLDQKTESKTGSDSVGILFGKELAGQFKNWKCSVTRTCEGVLVKIRNYQSTPISLNDSRLVSSGTQVRVYSHLGISLFSCFALWYIRIYINAKLCEMYRIGRKTCLACDY